MKMIMNLCKQDRLNAWATFRLSLHSLHFQKIKNFTILKVADCRLGGMHTGFDGMHVGFDGMHIGLALFMLLFRYAPILARFSTICIP